MNRLVGRLWILLGGFTLLMIVMGVGAVGFVRENVDRRLKDHLQLVLEGTRFMIETSLEGIEQQAEIVRSYLWALPWKQNEGKFLDPEFWQQLHLTHGYASLLHHNGVLGFAVTGAKAEHHIYVENDAFAKSLSQFRFPVKGEHVEISLPLLWQTATNTDDQGLIAVKIPLKSPPKEGGLNLWMLHDAKKVFQGFLTPGRTGSTGELYAFDSDGLMISESRFHEHLYLTGLLQPGQGAPLRIRLEDPEGNLLEGAKKPSHPLALTKMAQAAIKGDEGLDTNGYRDYRGVPVVGAWMWMAKYGFGVAHEIDLKEANSNVTVVFQIVVVLVLLLLAATLGLAWLTKIIQEGEQEKIANQKRIVQMERDLTHAARVAMMGELATGLAHEINQPLGAIVNYARTGIFEIERAKEKLATPLIHERLMQIEQCGLRAGEVIRRLRRLVSKGEVEISAISIRTVLDDTLKILKPEIDSFPLNLEITHAAHLPDVRGDEVQLQQVLINLFRNGIDAMKGISGRSHKISVQIFSDFFKKNVIIEITDTGGGISMETQNSLFDPFTSTKKDGMGLGLTISRSIVESFGGSILLKSTSPAGTCFSIRLPVYEEVLREQVQAS